MTNSPQQRNLSPSDLRTLCAKGEGRHLDYKESRAESGGAYGDWRKKGKYDFLKDLLAMANSVTVGEKAHVLLGVAEGEDGVGIVTGYDRPKHMDEACAVS